MSYPTPRRDNAIDGLRALAVIAVIVFHVDATLLPGGFTGVDLFFVVSGFVISQSLASRPNDHAGRFLLDFYRRRVLRLLPALLCVLLVTFLWSALLIPRAWRNEQFDQTGLGALLGVSNVVLAWQDGDYFSPGGNLNPFLHTWTLGVEEQFYLLFPLLFLAWLRGRNAQRWSRWLLPLLAVASLGFAAWQTRHAPISAFYLLPARFWELASGALLYQLVATRRLAPHWQGWALPGLMLLLVGFLFVPEFLFAVPGVIGTVVGTLMLLAAATAAGNAERAQPLMRVLQWRPLAYLGRLSYSLYLWHWPLLVVLRWTYGMHGVALWAYPVLLLMLACASYHGVECPLRAAAWGRRWHPGKVLVLAVSAVAASSGAAWATIQYTEVLSLSTTRDGQAWRSQRYPAWRPLERIDAPALAGRQLFVAGDSHAAAYRTMVSMAARQFDMKLQIDERGGCAIAGLLRPSSGECLAFSERVLAQIEASARPGDIVLLASMRMPESRDETWPAGEPAVWTAQQEALDVANRARGEAEAAQILARLQALQVHIIIDAPMPVFRSPAYRCSDAFNRMNPACAAGLTVPRKDLETLRAPSMAALERLQARYPALQVWDPLPTLCPSATCSAMAGTQPLFFDQDHLSGHGNRVLLPGFDRLLMKLGDGGD